MLPSDNRLLAGIRDALTQSIAADPSSKIVPTLAAAAIGVDELILRSEFVFWSAYYDRGLKLLNVGSALLSPPDANKPKSDLPQKLDGSTSAAILNMQLQALQKHLCDAVAQFSRQDSRERPISQYLAQVLDWENELHQLRATRARATHDARDPPGSAFTKDAIENYLCNRFPQWGEVSVSDLRKLPGGFSKTTVLFQIESPVMAPRSLVIRAEQAYTLVFFDGAKIENEFKVLQLLFAEKRRVAEPLWLETGTQHFGVKFLVSVKADGRNTGTAAGVHEEISDRLVEDLVRNLSEIHATPVDASNPNVARGHLIDWYRFRTLTESTRHHIEYWREQIAAMKLPPSPMVLRTMKWLLENIPPCEEAPTLIHRDFGPHNILVKDDRVSCILDWEGATMGDPAEDICWMTDIMRGRVERKQVLDLYIEFSGRRIGADRLRYFDVFNGLKYAVMCSLALSLFENNPLVPISACQLGLLYPYHGTAGLNHHIEVAETGRETPDG